MVLKKGSQTSAGAHAVLRMLAFLAILNLAACGASGVLAGTSQADAQGAVLQNATATMACQPAPNEAPQQGAGRRF